MEWSLNLKHKITSGLYALQMWHDHAKKESVIFLSPFLSFFLFLWYFFFTRGYIRAQDLLKGLRKGSEKKMVENKCRQFMPSYVARINFAKKYDFFHLT